jgi:hypothetical protein
MIFVYAFLLFALFAVWAAIAFDRGNRAVDQALAEEIRGGGYTTPGRAHCRCDWLGEGTPEHDASPLCVSLRPDADRDGDQS